MKFLITFLAAFKSVLDSVSGQYWVTIPEGANSGFLSTELKDFTEGFNKLKKSIRLWLKKLKCTIKKLTKRRKDAHGSGHD